MDDKLNSIAPSQDDGEQITDDYQSYHSALDIDTNANWKSLPKRKPLLTFANGGEDLELALRLATLSVAPSSAPYSEAKKRVKGHVAIKDFGTPSYASSGLRAKSQRELMWTRLRRGFIHADNRTHHQFSLYHGLKSSRTLRVAPDTINKIHQHHGLIAIASCVAGGRVNDILDHRTAPYNRKGNLVLWHEGTGHVLKAHRRSNNTQTHYYNVNDIQWQPVAPYRLVSSGADGTVQIWDCEQLKERRKPKLVRSTKLDCEPSGLSFKSQDPVFAVEGSDGYIYIFRDTPGSSNAPTGLPLAPDIGHQTINSIWGQDVSSHIIFASSAAHDGDDYTGYHKAFDVKSGKQVCEFDANEAAQKLAVDKTGHSLVIATEASKSDHFLRQYDARRRLKRTQTKVELQPFAGAGRAEVNQLSFSPDSVYIAVARSDNMTHIYDSRFLSHGPLHVFVHDGEQQTAEDSYGIVEAQWVEGKTCGLGLVTGGNDGMFRFRTALHISPLVI